ncbi:SAM hydrolase/SAM-dependent halogenase family protein [Lacrimispora indolis]|uniref:SAM hydrolase/SAM-dependent halogenase family protein n=1 Tax=Lacrimispora indolis TaxID=69825 RepID=UPI00045E6104|nr:MULTISPECIES: SAM-dependent chlorinase/fluorinase [Lachnospiraceae]MBE7720401.1 DNA-directed RNA polymerase subunit delta [Lacrimispora celerecrescens]
MKPILVFQTDFTYKEGAVSSMYGVVKCVDRELEIMDGTHELPQYDTWSASYRLYQSLQFWPEGTIYVSVVDPGVGTGRRPCVAKTVDGYYIVSPDNGSLTHVKRKIGIESVREIDESVNRLRGKGTEGVAIFHGRDLFGYTAARLASGIIDFEGVGPEYPVEEIVEHPILEPTVTPGKVEGIFEINDPNFGNLWTNIPLKDFKEAGFEYGDFVNLVIKYKDKIVFEQKVLFHQSFGFAKKGDPMIYNNELMKVAVAVSQGDFCSEYHLGYGAEWTVEFTK